MKISQRRKMAAKKQRQKRIQQYFNAYGRGSEILLNKKRYIVIDQKAMNEEYYLLLQGARGNPFVAKFIYSTGVKPVRIQTTSKNYNDNKEFFDRWRKQGKLKQQLEICEFFDNMTKKYSIVVLRNKADKDHICTFCKYVLKKKLKGKYYFVVRDEENNYQIAKLVWYGFAKTVKVTQTEFDKNSAEFEDWIQEAKCRKTV